MNIRTEMVLLEVLEELTDGFGNIEITDKTMESALIAEGIIVHGGSRRALLRAELAEGGEEKADKLIAAIQNHYNNYHKEQQ